MPYASSADKTNSLTLKVSPACPSDNSSTQMIMAMEHWLDDTDGTKTCPNPIFSTTKSKLNYPKSNPGLRGEKPGM